MFVTFFVRNNGHSLVISGPGDVFEEANRQFGRRIYELQFVSEHREAITWLSGLSVIPDRTISDTPDAGDTLIVAGERVPNHTASPALIRWLRRCVSGVRRYGSVSTGTFILGAAGLLDDKRVTTQSEFVPALAEAFPRTIVVPGKAFLREGALFTSAGATTGIDMALSLIAEDHGEALAVSVARYLAFYPAQPAGQPDFSGRTLVPAVPRSPIQQVQDWVRDNLQSNLTVHGLAQRAGMGDRTFARTFRQMTGLTPANFVEAARVDAARQMLEQTRRPLQRIAASCGFSTPQALRRAFFRQLGIMPAVYRTSFRSSPHE